MLSYLNGLEEKELERLALENHMPKKAAIYISVDRNMDYKVIPYDKLLECEDLIKKDYYSILLSLQKSVDVKKNIQSNNQYTLFVKDWDKFDEERIDAYYERLGYKNSTECQERKTWVLERVHEFHNISKSNVTKIFFDAPLDDYIIEGNKYFDKFIFNNIQGDTKAKIFSELKYGVPLTISLSSKKPYIRDLRGGHSSTPYACSKEGAYKIKFFIDSLKGYYRKGYDKVYIDHHIHPVKRGKIPMQRLDGGLYIQFTIGDTGDLKILEIQNFTVGNTSETLNPKILNFYHSISKLFCEEKLYDLMCSYDDYFNTNKFLNNKKELAKLAMICKKIFLLQQKISEIEYNRVMRGSLLSIIKNDLGNDIKKDLSRLYFISDLDDFFLKRENL